MMKKAYLILENQILFEGEASEGQKNAYGEVVFTTGMTGYCESLTDPSYAGQILVFTYPLIGNYGVSASSHWESKKIHAKGVIVSEAARNWSHHGGLCSLKEWLHNQEVPLLCGVDTRALTKRLRTHGTPRGIISYSSSPSAFEAISSHLVAGVSIAEKMVYGKGKKRVIAVDCGMKENMIRMLTSYPIEVVRVPYNYDYTQEHFDGIFLSNGPGDPTACVETISILKKAMALKKPIFGVCLGSQLMALAAGAQTMKLKFGHRGHNQPCFHIPKGRAYITSQNHGYAVDEKTLPEQWKVIFRNLNDGSVEGIAHGSLPFFSVQFHPESAPGPTDTKFLFDEFYACL